jgi:radical SAM superfamily enzyme YgiQ (UPF0313 family)
MKALLSHGYFLEEDPKEREIMRPYPPLGLLYVAAFLEQNGIEVNVFDSTFSSKIKLFDEIRNQQPDVIALYVNLMTKVNVLDIIRFVRNEPQLEHIPIILGGPEVRYHAENFLQFGADYLVIGEGEETALELIQALSTGDKNKVGSVAGIAYLSPKGECIFSEERSKIREINALPWPAREKIDLNKYLTAWKQHHGQNALSVSTMRGCPYTCKWCSRAVYGLSYRRRDPGQVADELKWIQETYNPDTVWFVDDVFTVSHKWLKAFRDALDERGFRIPFECITRADRMSEAVIADLKAAGCFRVWIGAESGSQKIIDLMDRRVEVGMVREMIQKTREAGMEAGTFIMLGYPGETEEDIRQTVDHLKAANPDHFTITVAYPIKGTGLYQEVESSHLTDLPWESSSDRQIDFVRTYPRRYYDFAVRHVVNEVRFHQLVSRGNRFSPAALGHKARSIAAKGGMWFERVRAGVAKS